MTWSISKHISFKECPRKWYFAYKLARTSTTKEPIRKEAFYLKQLKTIDAWRGIIVDKIISEYIIPSYGQDSTISLDKSLDEARNCFDNQLKFAKEKQWRNVGVTKSDPNYMALWELESESENDLKETLEKAWSEIELALTNFYQMTEIWDLFESADSLIAQEQLGFHQLDIYVICKPDLILLFKDKEPILIDWKVHRYGTKEYRQQLSLYALALTESKTFKKKYPIELAGVFPDEVRLKEVQLLTEDIYHYDVTDSETDEIKDLISSSSRKMNLIIDDEDKDFSYLNVPITGFAEKCQKCQFQTICWENSTWEKEIKCRESKQTSFLY